MTDDLQRILGRMETMLEQIQADIKDHKSRLTWVETKLNYAAGVGATLMFTWGIFSTKLLTMLGLK